MKHGKKYLEALKKYDREQTYPVEKAVELVKSMAYAKFDETIELALNLNLKKSHTIRDTMVLPHQFKKEKKILVFAKGDKAKEALDNGAAYAGDNDLIEKIKGGWMDFDVCVATPDMMKDVGRLGPVLGRRGLMPNPKTQTVTFDIKGAINELKKGRTEYRADKAGGIHIAVAKVSMDADKIKDNVMALLSELERKRPSDVKGEYIKSIAISSTMGPGVRLSAKEVV